MEVIIGPQAMWNALILALQAPEPDRELIIGILRLLTHRLEMGQPLPTVTMARGESA